MASAIAAFLLFFATLDYTKKTVDEMTEARFGTQRPVLHPRQALILEQDAKEVDWDMMHEISIKVANAGPGVAMNVCGVFMDHCHNPKVTDRRFSYMKRDILLAAEERAINFARGGTLVNGDDRIGGIKLGPPERQTSFQNPSAFVIGRLTITYSDIFGRKHATSIYTGHQEQTGRRRCQPSAYNSMATKATSAYSGNTSLTNG